MAEEINVSQSTGSEDSQEIKKVTSIIRWLIITIMVLLIVIFFCIFKWKGLLWMVGIDIIATIVWSLYHNYKVHSVDSTNVKKSVRKVLYSIVGGIAIIIILWLCISIPRWFTPQKEVVSSISMGDTVNIVSQ